MFLLTWNVLYFSSSFLNAYCMPGVVLGNGLQQLQWPTCGICPVANKWTWMGEWARSSLIYAVVDWLKFCQLPLNWHQQFCSESLNNLFIEYWTASYHWPSCSSMSFLFCLLILYFRKSFRLQLTSYIHSHKQL